ncbi:MAG TPA: hypothetical protein VGQ83_39860 [Polyangia bacterium]|jgi:hypothetical protein
MLTHELLESRWNRLIKELSEQPEITVESEKQSGAPESEVRAFLEENGIPQDPDLVTFYTWANGLKLSWLIDSDGAKRVGGNIEMSPIADLNNPEAWYCPDFFEEEFEGYGEQFDQAIGHVFPFDFWRFNCDESIEVAALFKKGDTVNVFVSEDYMACMTDTALVSFGEYIELIFRTYGSPAARKVLQLGCSNDEAVRASERFPELLTKEVRLPELMQLDIYRHQGEFFGAPRA